jgi:hypothetical protein
MAALKPYAHQKKSIAFATPLKAFFDASDPGCVSADTEFLTPSGWKRIDQYSEGDQVAQFHPATREIEFVAPLAYVKRPCTRMIAIAPARGTSQRLSHEHRVLYYRPDGTHDVCSAAEYMEGLHKQGAPHFKRKFCTTFSVRNATQLSLTKAEIRVMVAVIADGHFSSNSTRCTVRVKKARKIERLRRLLAEADIVWGETQCGGQPEFQVFRFNAPWRHKEFGAEWWTASQSQLEVIADELPHWDSATGKAEAVRFSSFSEASANFAQFAFAAAKHPASLTMSYRDRRSEGRGFMFEYCVHAQYEDKLVGPGRKDSVFEINNPEGYKYCFEVPTSFLLLRHNGYIFATGNTGKTGVQICVFAARRKKGGKCALVLAPKSLLRPAWFNDFGKFAPHLTCSIAYANNREAAFAAEADVYITNIDAVNWLAKQKPKFFAKFDTLIIDEITAFKHATSGRSRAAKKIKKYFTYRSGLSGTPNSNTVCDIWHPMNLLDDGKRLGSTFYGFRSACCTPVQVGPKAEMVNWQDKEGAEEAVFGLIADITMRHKFEECIDIPPNHMYTVGYQLTPKQLKAYNQMKALSIAEIGKKVITAINGAAVTTKLQQIASGAAYTYDEQGDDIAEVVDSGRYELIVDLIEERQHSVCFYLWRHQRDQLIAEAVKRDITFAVIDGETPIHEREQIVQHYQNGFYRVLFAHPQSAGHGLTLTRGTATIWASPTYNLEHFVQGNKRTYRAGQTQKTETIVVLGEGTIDEIVFQALETKNVRMSRLLDLLQEQP